MPMKGGGGGGGKDVRAGGAFVEIFGRDSLTALLTKLKARVMAFGAFLNTAGKTAMKAGGALALPLTLLLGQGASRAAEVDRLSEAFGMSAESMSKLAAAAEIAGVSIEEVMQNQAKYQKLIDSAPSISGDQAKAATAATQEFKSSLMALQNAMLPILKIITPIITAIGEFAKRNAGLVQIVAAVAAGLIAFGAVASVAGAAISGIAGAVGFVAPLLLPLLKVAAVLGIIVAAGYGIYKLLQQFETGRAIIGEFAAGLGIVKDIGGRAFADIGAAFSTTFGGIADALKAGDIALAGEIAMQGLLVVWTRTLLALTESWVAFKAAFVEGWHVIGAGAKLVWEQTTTAIAQGVVTLGEFIVHTFLGAIQQLIAGAAGLADALDLGDIAGELRSVGSLLGDARKDASKYAGDMRGALDQDLKARERSIIGQLDSEQAARDKFREGQIDAARSAFLRESAELDRLRAEAAAKVAATGNTERRGLLPSFVMPKREQLLTQARGGFAGANSAGQFGYGDKGESMLTELRKIGKLADNWIAATAHLNIIAKNSEKFGIVVGK